MKREDVKAKFPNMTDDELQWLMDEHGKGITREKNIAAQIQAQLDTANAQLQTAQDGLKAFEGVDVMLNDALYDCEAGDTVAVTIYRGGKYYTVDIKLTSDTSN